MRSSKQDKVVTTTSCEDQPRPRLSEITILSVKLIDGSVYPSKSRVTCMIKHFAVQLCEAFFWYCK